jgi:hypothetical protein
MTVRLVAARKARRFDHNIGRHLASKPTAASSFEQFMRFADASQGKHRADHRPDQTAFDKICQRVELASLLTGEHEMVGSVLSPSLDQVLRPRDVDDADHPSSIRHGKRAFRQVSPPMVSAKPVDRRTERLLENKRCDMMITLFKKAFRSAKQSIASLVAVVVARWDRCVIVDDSH